jgi:hypothetical protein
MSILTASPVSKNNFRSAILAGASLLFGFPAAAATLNPGDYTSLGLLGGSAIALDSSALTVNGGAGGVLVSQGGGFPGIAVFTFDGGSILGDVTVSGQIPIAILFRGSATITGQIDIGGTGRIGVGGGADGGLGGTSAADGDGPGAGLGGSTSASTSGIGSGSGGGFGTDGEHGGAGPTFRAGSAAYGDPLSAALQGGSGGGGGGWGNIRRGGAGGAGGGALEIGALTRLFFDGASIMANGADGASDFAGGGGGSGGGLLVHAFDIDIAGNVLMTANGGAGGNFGAIGNQGGCGGAGRIQMLHNTAGSFSNLGTIQATSGTGSVFCDRTVSSFTVTPDGTIGTPPGAQVPVPATLASLGSGLALLGFIGWRRRRTA